MARPSRRRAGRGARGAATLAVLLATWGSVAATGGNLRGYLELRPLVYFQDGTPDRVGWGRARAEWEQRAGPGLLFRIRGQVEGDWRDAGPEGVDPGLLYDDDEDHPRRALARIDEASLRWRAERLDLTAGRLVIPWGRADGFNPTDNLSPFDSLDPLQPERLATWGARGQIFAGRLTLEGDALLPTASRQPLLGTRWFPAPGRVDNPAHLPGVPATGPPTVPVELSDGDLVYPAWKLENLAWALKADYRGSAWEGSISHYDGWDDQPVFLPSVGPPAGPAFLVPVALDRVLPDLRVTGADVAWVTGRFILRAEAALHRRGPPDDSDFTFGVIEGEWSFGEWRLIAAWAEIRGEEAGLTTISRFEQGALPAAILRIGRDVATGTRFSAQILSNLDGDGSLTQVEASWPLGHALRLGAGLDILEGPEESFLGAFRDNDRLWGRLRWSF